MMHPEAHMAHGRLQAIETLLGGCFSKHRLLVFACVPVAAVEYGGATSLVHCPHKRGLRSVAESFLSAVLRASLDAG